MNKYSRSNKLWWEEVTPVHIRALSKFTKKFKSGNSSLFEIEEKELKRVKGKMMLHLLCHLGFDSISWYRKGADVTAIDISKKSIQFAQKLNKETKSQVRFICCDVYNARRYIKQKFDIVFCSYGILRWLYDLDLFMDIVSSFLVKGGYFYIVDFHPMINIIDVDNKGNFFVKGQYFSSHKPQVWKNETDYIDQSYTTIQDIKSWTWTVSDVLTYSIKNNLQIEFFHEFRMCPENIFGNLTQSRQNCWCPTDKGQLIPLIFSFKAKKQ